MVFYNPLNVLLSTPPQTTARPGAYIYDKNIFEFPFDICAWRTIEKNSYMVDKEGKEKHILHSKFLPFDHVVQGVPPCIHQNPQSQYPCQPAILIDVPPLFLAFVFLTLIDFRVCDGGVSLGVSFSTCCFCKLQNSSVARVGFLTWVTSALALFQNRLNNKIRM